MNSRAWYWVAAGVLALGLNSEYQHGGLKWAHRAVDRGREAANCVEVNTHRYLAMARLMFGADPAPEFPTEVVLAQVQEQVDGIQEKLQNKQITIDKVESIDVQRINDRVEPAMMGRRFMVLSCACSTELPGLAISWRFVKPINRLTL